MCIAVIGGMDRLQKHYLNEARKFGIKLAIFNKAKAGMAAGIRHVDAVVIFTNKISHNARNEAMAAARDNRIPVYMFHSCGLCTLRECFHCLQGKNHH
jgi:ABC-type uncharacterized transport system substrate-binding protein